MLQRVDAMEGELGALVESLRTGANRLSADLSLLSGNMGELYDGRGRAPSATAGRAADQEPSRRRRGGRVDESIVESRRPTTAEAVGRRRAGQARRRPPTTRTTSRAPA